MILFYKQFIINGHKELKICVNYLFSGLRKLCAKNILTTLFKASLYEWLFYFKLLINTCGFQGFNLGFNKKLKFTRLSLQRYFALRN